MRTTIDIQDDLLRHAKALAAETDRTLGEVVSDALRVLFQRDRAEAVRPLPVGRFSATAPGVDLSPRGLRDALDDEDVERSRARR